MKRVLVVDDSRTIHLVAPDGYLVLGETESIVGLTIQFIIPDGNRDYFHPDSAFGTP